MSTRVLLSLYLGAFVAGCASPRRAPRDEASAANSEREIWVTKEKFELVLFIVTAVTADNEVAQLKPLLALTPQQETAFREAYAKQSAQTIEQAGDALSSRLKAFATRNPAPPGETAPSRVPTQRELWQPILTPQQLAAYDTFMEKKRKERAAKLATERLKRMDSELGLTEDQRNHVREILMAYEEQGQIAEDNFGPLPNHDAEDTNLATVLTPAQFKKYQNLSPRPHAATQKQYAGAFFIPPTFSLPHFGSSGSFRAR